MTIDSLLHQLFMHQFSKVSPGVKPFKVSFDFFSSHLSALK